MYDVFIMDLGGHDANVHALQNRFPHATTVRYYDNHLDTIRRCIAKARTPWGWIVSSCCEYADFNFEYRAVPWEESQLHCWASGSESFGDTFLINVNEFKRQQDIELLEYYEYINWHTDGVPRLPQDIFTMNMGGHDISIPNTQVVRYYNSHLDTVKRCVSKATTPTVWVTASCCDYSNFNFDHVMPLWGPEQLHCWASGDEKFGDTFLIDVKRFKRQENIELLEWYKDIHWHADGVPRLTNDTFVMNLGGHDDNVNQLEQRHITQTVRYYNSHLDTIKRCISKAATPAVWIIASCCDYSNFDFNYTISFWGPDQLHCWASNEETFGDTFLINVNQFRKQQDIELLEWYKDIHWHSDGVPRLPVDTFVMNMGGHDDNVEQFQQISNSQVIRYYDNHLDTIRRCIAKSTTPAVWIIASCCDYSKFKFDQTMAFWGPDQLHCWASGTEKFGDTFLISTHQFRKQQDIELLEWYKEVNWHSDGVSRLPWPILELKSENITEELKDYRFDSPYVWLNEAVDFDPPLWAKRAFYSFNATGSISIAPRDIQAHLVSQIYDYPYIIKQKTAYLAPTLLDIIYVSNGEPEAERWYTHLAQTCKREVKRVIDINGRSAAYKAAAKLSSTPWFFAVFAKLEVNPEFDWAWQPDWLQEPKHYIFNSRNPVNGLEYGHMGVIAYNRQLVLDTDAPGLDFTLSKAHAVVPRLSAVAHYNTTPELTWRTAFREVLKLKDDVEKTSSVESDYRLETWLTVGDGDYAEFSILGAADAVDYYEQVKGDYTELMRSFEWAWLREYYSSKYSGI
jgi:hypothetical protein